MGPQATAAPMDKDTVPSSAFEQFKSIATCWSRCISTIHNSGSVALFRYNLITRVFTFFMVWCVLPMLRFVPTDQVEEGSLFLQKLAMGSGRVGFNRVFFLK